MTVLHVRSSRSGDNLGRRRLAFRCVSAASLALVVALDLMNPDAADCARQPGAGGRGCMGQPLDADYLSCPTLSADRRAGVRDRPGAIADPAVLTKLACGLQAQAEILTDRGSQHGLARGELGLGAAGRALRVPNLGAVRGAVSGVRESRRAGIKFRCRRVSVQLGISAGSGDGLRPRSVRSTRSRPQTTSVLMPCAWRRIGSAQPGRAPGDSNRVRDGGNRAS